MTRPSTLRSRLALSHALLALTLVLASASILEWQTTRLRRNEAAEGAQRDAEVEAGRVARVMGRADVLARLVSDEQHAGRSIEVYNEEAAAMAGVLPTSTRAGATDAANQALDGDGSGRAIRGQRFVVGAAPLIRDDAVIGAVVLVERAPAMQWWSGATQLALVPGGVLVAAAALAGWIIAGRVTRPIHDLTVTATRVALGDLDSPEPRVTQGGTEVVTLGASVHRLALRVRSISERARSREHQQALVLKRMSHQLRTPIAVLALRVDELKDDEIEGAKRAALGDVVERQVDILTRVSDDLFNVARGDGETAAEPVDMEKLVERVVAQMEPLARPLRTKLTMTAQGPASVVANQPALDDAVANLVENALKFTPSGGRVDVRLRTVGETVVVEVEDTGPGFAAGERDDVVLPWVRGRAGSTAPGTGLGLSLAAETATRAGGRLELDDGSMGGALVRLRLPRADARGGNGNAPIAE